MEETHSSQDGCSDANAWIALLAVGLEPGVGVLHGDLTTGPTGPGSDGGRPQVDAFVLQFLESHTFSAKDCCETRQGICR